jgi:hypothetical protein
MRSIGGETGRAPCLLGRLIQERSRSGPVGRLAFIDTDMDAVCDVGIPDRVLSATLYRDKPALPVTYALHAVTGTAQCRMTVPLVALPEMAGRDLSVRGTGHRRCAGFRR